MLDVPNGPVVFLTGGSGMVGRGLCKDLLAAGRPRIFILTRNRSGAPELLSGVTQVIVLEGDITVPQLGLAPDVYKSLQSSVTEVVHCAANTRFGLSLDAIRTPNVTGTRNILDFALGCRRIEKFVHISTAYVAGRASGRILEEVNHHRHGFFNTYQQSKYEAEELVLDAMKRLPAIIVRFSSIIGDSRTGEVTGFNHVHQLLRLLPRSVLPVAPGHPDAPIDLVPTEWAVGALSHLVTSAFSAGHVYHLCSGPQKSLTVAEMMRTTLALFENHPIGRTWLPIELPELISLPEFELFVEKSRRKGDKLLSALLAALGYFLPHLATFQFFENQHAAKALETSAVVLPHAREYYPKVIEYCFSANWIGRRKGHDSGPMPPLPRP